MAGVDCGPDASRSMHSMASVVCRDRIAATDRGTLYAACDGGDQLVVDGARVATAGARRHLPDPRAAGRDDVMNPEAKQARFERAFRQLAIPEAAALLPVLDEFAARPGLMWRYDTELGIRASCTTATPTITTGRAGSVGDAWTDDGEPDHLCPVALIAMGTEPETAEHLQKLRTIHDNAAERVHDALRQSGHYHPAAGLDPDRLNGAEKLLVMASDGEAGAGSYAWPPALSDEEVTNTRHAIGQYLIAATAAEPAERQ